MIEGMPASNSTARPIGRRSQMRTDLGQKDRDAEADRNGDHHRDHGGDQRAVDRAERAQHRRIGRRRPARGEQEGESVFPHRRPGADDQRKNDAAEDEQHRDRAGAGDPVKGNVAELEGAERPGAIVRSGSFHHVALNGHVCHANPLYLSSLESLARSDLPDVFPRHSRCRSWAQSRMLDSDGIRFRVRRSRPGISGASSG